MSLPALNPDRSAQGLNSIGEPSQPCSRCRVRIESLTVIADLDVEVAILRFEPDACSLSRGMLDRVGQRLTDQEVGRIFDLLREPPSVQGPVGLDGAAMKPVRQEHDEAEEPE